MSYTQFGTELSLALVRAYNGEGEQGCAKAMEAAGSVAPGTPEHLAHSAASSFASQCLLIIGSKHRDGRTTVRITGHGYQAAERIREQLAAQITEAETPPRRIGF